MTRVHTEYCPYEREAEKKRAYPSSIRAKRRFYALLGSSLGVKVARMIIDHRADLRRRVVRRIIIISGDGDDEDASVEICILFAGSRNTRWEHGRGNEWLVHFVCRATFQQEHETARRRRRDGEEAYVSWAVRNAQRSIKNSSRSWDWRLGAGLVGKHALSLTGERTACNSASFPAQISRRPNGKAL